MTFDIDLLARTPDLRELEAAEARVAMTLRLWVVMNKLGRCPLAAMGEKLDSRRAAAHLHLMLEEIGAAWPEPFCVNPPCCPRLSHDEALVLDMIRVASRDDRPGFDRLLSDLLPADAREPLFASAALFAAAL
ncbi:addiction module antidote protein [Allosphingosinicella sp.]|uniref:addiction module antidote protein n=1 Tax=Allosphingosinicella sp. TaxID=2823234 RepID=UPI002FC1FA25